MFEAHLDKFDKARIDVAHLNVQAGSLADRIAATLTNYTKISLVSFGKIATGDTLKSIHWTALADRRAAVFGVAATGSFRRQVIANKAFFFIQSGRRAGAKMPIRLIGVGPRGGKIFEPLPALLRWFAALSIPRSAWFPILRAIKARGIRPTNVRKRAIAMALPAVRAEAALTGARIAKGLIRRG